MRDQVVVVTGASSGIGWAAAEAFARRGARLALVARRGDKLMELAARLPGEPQVLPWDVGDWKRAPELIAKVLERWGRLDVLVNNAGVMKQARFHEETPERVEEVCRVNYVGAAALIRAALVPMRAQGRGHVLNVASINGLLGFPYTASYSASKFALVGLTESLRREYYGTGVTFTSFCPGTVRTPMTEDLLADPELGKLARPKTAAQAGERIVRACERREAEVVYGDVPGFLVGVGRALPRLTDWVVHQVVKRTHPLARKT